MPSINGCRAFFFALACVGVASAATTRPATRPADLPLRAVTLYTSGVGFFRHEGEVTGDGTATLKFKTQQINDVIKSLVVQDAGGRVNAVRYPSADPVDKTLRGFQIDMSGNPSLGELLRQLRGTAVTFGYNDGSTHGGVIVGLSKKAFVQPQVQPTDTWVATLMEGDKLVQYRVDDAQSVTLDDATLNGELRQALTAIAAGRDQDKKPVTVAFSGAGPQSLSLGYVVETPVWKTTYRLLLEDKKADLQGWAVIENQTDADWQDVSLSLVSGRPMSFVMDLYQPLYVQRPVVQLDLFQGLRPPTYAGGSAVQMQAAAAQMDTMAASPAPMMAESRALKDARKAQVRFGLTPGSAADESVKASALTAKLGELFQYTIEHVSLPRQQSSLVPIVTDAVTAEAVSIYNAGVLPRHPLNGALLTNSTGKLLPQGPITVLDHGAYAGDARIDDLPAGQKRLLSFGVDLQVLVDSEGKTRLDITGGRISKGVLVLTRREAVSQTYAVDNKADHDKTLIVEHPIAEGFTLADTPAPMEKTDTVYRFKLTAAKSASTKLAVTEQRTVSEAVALLDTDLNALAETARQGAIPAKVRDALAGVVQKRQALGDLQRQVADKDAQLGGITVEQQRIRQNMQAVDREGAYYKRLLAKLNEQESRIEALQGERDALNAKADAARGELESSLAGMSID